MLKNKLIELFEENKDILLSGQQIAKKFNVSRNAVYKAVAQMKEIGFQIEIIRNKGYRYLNVDQPINETSIIYYTDYLDDIDYFVFDTINSTNLYAKQVEIERYALVVSNHQSEGKGRYGKHFYSPSNTGVYMSLILPVSLKVELTQQITALVAVLIRKTIYRLYRLSLKIKWINDLFYKDKKIAGILTEGILNMETGALDSIIIGIGINVFHLNDLSSELSEIVAALEDFTNIQLNRNQLIGELVKELIKIPNYLKQGTNGWLEDYRKYSYTLGKKVRVMIDNQMFYGKAIAINDDSSLQVLIHDESICIYSGQVSILKDE